MGVMKSFVRSICYSLGLRSAYQRVADIKKIVTHVHDRVRCRHNYQKVLKRIRGGACDQKLTVLFWVSNRAKWKTQSLVDALKASGRYEPLVAVAVDEQDSRKLDDAALRRKLQDEVAYYEGRGNACVTAYDCESRRAIPLSKFRPDIVFYQEPLSFCKEHTLQSVSRYALTFYMPYSVEMSGGNRWFQRQEDFHHLLFARYALTEYDAEYLREITPRRAGDIISIGHTMLDEYLQPEDPNRNRALDGCIIYAPHFSFHTPSRHTTISSFDENGLEMLAFAQAHPKYKWVFKPHPALASNLRGELKWSDDQIQAYYDAWGQLGAISTDSNYITLFRHSAALITDSASFLCEYPPSGHPLIRLIPKHFDFPMRPGFGELVSTLYEVRSMEEMTAIFNRVILNGDDYKRDQRIKAAASLGGAAESCASRILNHIDGLLR